MREMLKWWPAAMMILTCFSSCLEEEEVVVDTDCYISSMTLGNVKRLSTTTSSTGEDSTFYYFYDASGFLMSINHLAGVIENKDSLPVNSKIDAVLVDITASGTVCYRYADEEDVNWMEYSSSDSIDFTHPLIFRVYAQDASLRDYTVRLNVHRTDGDVFGWKQVAEMSGCQGAEDMSLKIKDGLLYLFVENGNGVQLFTADDATGSEWTQQTLSGISEADVSTLQLFEDAFYVSTEDGDILRSEDGISWAALSDGMGGMLFASDRNSLYLLKDGTIQSSSDGMVWEAATLDAPTEYLPATSVASASYVQSNGRTRLVMLGNRDGQEYAADTVPVIWSLSAIASDKWVYCPSSPDNGYCCPKMPDYNLVWYHDVLMVVGSVKDAGSGDGRLVMLVSRDHGVTWKEDESYALPEGIMATESIACVVDDKDVLWVIAGQQVWRGKLNKLDFENRE